MKPPAALVRSMTRWDLAAVSINGIIGAGIFGLPSAAAAVLGSASAIAFIICGFIVYVFVLCFAEAASHFTEAGGPYLYARIAFGRFAGFEVGWAMWLSRLSAFAANTNLLVSYLGYFTPAATTTIGRAFVLISVSAVLAVINIRGVKSGAKFGTVLALVKVGALVLFGCVGLALVNWNQFPPVYFSANASWGAGILLIIYAYSGFEGAAVMSAEAKRPTRDVGWALIVALGACALIYVAVQTVALGTVTNLAATDKPLADSAKILLGPIAGGLVAVLACISIVGNLSGMILAMPRLTYAFAEGNDLPRIFGKLHPIYRTPVFSIVTFSAAAAALALSGTFVWLVTVSVVARLASYLATCLSVPRLRTYFRDGSRFKLPFGVAMPAVGVLLCAWLLAHASYRDLASFALASGAGAALYFGNRTIRPR